MELGSEGLVARFVIWRNGFRNCCRAGWSLAGQVLENFVIGEIGRQRTWAELSVQMFHYRDREQREVDLVLEANDGRVVGIDVKSSTTARAEDFRHLEHLRRLAGKNFHHGYVLYTGQSALPFGDRLSAIPISNLWTHRPGTG
jgi:uncharacterized protein